MNRKQRKTLVRMIASAALLVLLSLLPLQALPLTDGGVFWLRLLLFLVPYFLIGWDILRKAVRGIAHRQVFDENFLMAVATVGAIVLGEYTEGVAVMLFYQIGELFQSIAVGRSRRSISDLMDIRPDYANIMADGVLQQVDPDEVAVGSEIVVQPGEKIPIDGVVLTGSSALNTAALTGESAPRDVEPGDEVISGCVNLTGLLTVQTTKEFGASAVSKILELVENAGSRKSRSENFISRFARYYTPAVCFGALILAILPPLVRLLLSLDPAWGDWIYRALTFLVISCPCALVVSVPLTFFAGIGGASRRGILIKGSNFMEALAKTKTVVFDKTGTVTRGVFEVCGVHHTPIPENELLGYAACAESASSHPIAKSILSAAGGEVDRSHVSNIEEIGGNGVTATVDGICVAAGNDKLMRRIGIVPQDCSQTGTIVHVALDGRYMGHILIRDVVKPNAAEAIRALRNTGVTQSVMLTGDDRRVAEEVAKELNIDRVYGELLPADKVERIEELLARQNPKETLAFVGDGVNDAPVLSRADVGIAMGALGSDAAVEAADIVLMDDDPMKIALGIRISRKCMNIVHQNIVFALAVKFICLLLGVLGIANMWMAVFADVGVMVLAVLNAVRALFVKNL